jgi:hypothetical protein
MIFLKTCFTLKKIFAAFSIVVIVVGVKGDTHRLSILLEIFTQDSNYLLQVALQLLLEPVAGAILLHSGFD